MLKYSKQWFNILRNDRKRNNLRLTFSLCSLRLTMAVDICWSRKTKMVPKTPGSTAAGASHQYVTDSGCISQPLQPRTRLHCVIILIIHMTVIFTGSTKPGDRRYRLQLGG